jgi:hypothetical protein
LRRNIDPAILPPIKDLRVFINTQKIFELKNVVFNRYDTEEKRKVEEKKVINKQINNILEIIHRVNKVKK